MGLRRISLKDFVIVKALELDFAHGFSALTGETGAGQVLVAVRGQSEAIRQLAYRLYTLCERQGWAEDARAYNELVTSWTGIENAAYAQEQGPAQSDMDW